MKPVGIKLFIVSSLLALTGTCIHLRGQPACAITGGSDFLCPGDVTVWSASEVMDTYAWTGPSDFTAVTREITIDTEGEYSLTVTSSDGTASCSRYLVVGPVLSATVSHSDVLCQGASTGSIDLVITGGTPGYRYLWNNGSESEDLDNIPEGDYTVVVTDSKDCTVTVQVSVSTVYPALSPGSINTDLRQFCAGGTAAIGGSSPPFGPATGGSGTYLYIWQLQENCTGNWTDIPETNTTSYTPVAPAVTTCYRRKVHDVVCSTEGFTGSKTFEIFPDPVSQDIEPIPEDQSVCAGTPVSATFSGGSGGFPAGTQDIYEFSTDGGNSWSSYTPGENISTSGLSGVNILRIRTRRISTGVNGCNYGSWVTISRNVNPLPLTPPIYHR